MFGLVITRSPVLRESFQFGDQPFEFLEPGRVRAVADARPIHLALNEPRLAEDLQVLRDGGLREVHRTDELAADTAAPRQEQPQKLHPSWMGECPGQLG
jgi:hypothetical protein